MTVERNTTIVNIWSWYFTYFFFTTLDIHNPKAKEKAPMNTPTTAVEIPRYEAPTANTPAPAVQRGQCAETTLGNARNINIKYIVMVIIVS